MNALKINIEKLAEKLASGGAFSAQERLAWVSRRQAPSTKEWWVLACVSWKGFWDLNQDVDAKSLLFLKNRLSSPLFKQLTYSLSDDYAQMWGESVAVTHWDIKRLMNHKQNLRFLKKKCEEETAAADQSAQQRAICR